MKSDMERDIDYKVLGTSILIVGVIILANFLGTLYVLNNQQHQIDELYIENMKQNMRIGILEKK